MYACYKPAIKWQNTLNTSKVLEEYIFSSPTNKGGGGNTLSKIQQSISSMDTLVNLKR
jgi:hypothetical protein